MQGRDSADAGLVSCLGGGLVLGAGRIVNTPEAAAQFIRMGWAELIVSELQLNSRAVIHSQYLNLTPLGCSTTKAFKSQT